MKEFDFEQLKNLEIVFPESWVENALKVPSEKKKPKPVRLYRYASVTAACIVLASAIGFTMMLGFNRNVVPAEPDGGGIPENQISEESTVGTTGDRENPSVPHGVVENGTQGGTVVTEPTEGSSGANKKSNQKKQSTTQPNADKKSQAPSNGESQAETYADIPGDEEPTEEPETKDNIVPTTGDSWPSHQGEFGAGGDYKPRPTETEAYGCHFVTSVNRSAAQGNTYYCRIEDGSGNILGSGAAQKYDWGNPSWPLDLQYTADFVMYYGETYTVTFYSSNGVTVWSGAVYLKEHQTNYLLY